MNRQLVEANALINMLKANHFKLLSVRSDISNLPVPASPYTEYIQVRKDKQVIDASSIIMCSHVTMWSCDYMYNHASCTCIYILN